MLNNFNAIFYFSITLCTLTHAMQETKEEFCRIFIDLYRFKEEQVIREMITAYKPRPVRFILDSHVFPGELLFIDIFDNPAHIIKKLGKERWFYAKTLMHANGSATDIKREK